jgi:hypothetical protein
MTPTLRTNADNILARLAINAGVKPPHPHMSPHEGAGLERAGTSTR